MNSIKNFIFTPVELWFNDGGKRVTVFNLAKTLRG
jgi:hypothetical protein